VSRAVRNGVKGDVAPIVRIVSPLAYKRNEARISDLKRALRSAW